MVDIEQAKNKLADDMICELHKNVSAIGSMRKIETAAELSNGYVFNAIKKRSLIMLEKALIESRKLLKKG